MNRVHKENISSVQIGLMTYNNEATLERTLECLVKQTYMNKEIIVFDDFSTDRTKEILLKYAEKFPFIKLHFHEKNQGMYTNLKFLLKTITSEYFLWACPDDEYDHIFIEECIKVFNANKDYACVMSNSKIMYEAPDHVSEEKEAFQAVTFRNLSKNRGFVRDSVLFRVNNEQYVLFMHSLMKSSVLFKDDILESPTIMWSIEEIIPFYYLLCGGLGVVDKVLYIKHQNLKPLQDKCYESYLVANGIKNKFMCLMHWFVFTLTCSLDYSEKIELLWGLILLFYRYILYKPCHTLIAKILNFKHIIFNRGERIHENT